MTQQHVVAVYLTDRAYGGPEEGGWWYDTGTLTHLERVRRFDTLAEAEAYRETLAPFLAELNDGRRPVSSVLSDGIYVARIVRRRVDQGVPRGWPKRTPHYE